jgi:uncharacterized repeat protein (TIGR01451 family)
MKSFLSSLRKVDRQASSSRKLKSKVSKMVTELLLGENNKIISGFSDSKAINRQLPIHPSTVNRLKPGKDVENISALRLQSYFLGVTKKRVFASFFCVAAILGISQEKAFALPACSAVYGSTYNITTGLFNNKIYTISGATTTLFPGTTASTQNFGGLAQGINTNLYFDNGSNLNVYSYSGSATNTTGGTWQSWIAPPLAPSGPGGGWDGNIYYVGNNYHLYQVPVTGTVVDLGSLLPSAGDTIYSTLKYGDVASDANGRIYWYASVNGSGASYLYRIDKNTLKTTNLGATGPTAASGLAFNSSGQLITTTVPSSTTSTYSINPATLASSSLGTVSGLPANQVIYDLASCYMPTLDPNIGIAKSVANITTSQSPAITANVGNTLEYTVTITNTGNLASDSTTLSDAIPAGTTYVASSTKLNGTAVADISGKMPYDPTSTGKRLVNTTGQPLGAVLVGATNAAVVKFRVTINASGLPTTITNTASAGFPTVFNSTTVNNVAQSSANVSIPADFGDAPDGSVGTATGNYRTTAADNGPSHVIAAGLKLGAIVPDADSGLQQNAAANADGADEDAFTTLPNVPTTGTYSLTNIPVTNTTGSPATLYAWVDFNNNGSFEPGEYASATVANNATTANLSWTVPAGTVAAGTYARFRLTTQVLTDNTSTTEDERSFGSASNGEVEDYPVSIAAPVATRDYGDAPANYDSGTAASHLVPAAPTVYLGTLSPDKELAPSNPLDGSGDNSTGTNDEDGVTFVGGTTLNAGATASVSVVTNGTGTLYAWIDFNGNGTFESSERITNWAGGNSSTGGTTTLTFGVPEGFTGTTYARFRYSSDVAAANPTGSANDGEVEDYQITLAPRLTPATYTNGTPVRKGICSIYSATGADQVVTAPTGAKGLTVKLWGAGGGHEIVGTGYAGAGGYTDAQFGSSVVTPGAQFTLVVGRGGMSGGRPDEFSPTGVYGFGAVAGHEQGGGLAGLFTGGTAVLETDRARTLAIAGGGGGYEHSGGIGTGTTGGNGNGPSSGGQSTMRGATDNLTKVSNSSVIMTAHISSGGGGYQGGGRLPAPNPYSAVTGGNLANIAAASGGSGFVAGTATSGRILSTTDSIGTPPNTSDSDYLTGIGTAGTLVTNAGGNARAVLCWDVSDYGDAPATYDVGTPASHLLSSSPSVYLGAIAPDGESAPQPSVAADGDNTNGTSDEDALTTLANVLTTGSYSLNSIPVKNTSGAAATLNAWIDFNKDGVFQASEYTSVSIPANATTANLKWASIPAGTTAGSTYARFRITTDALSDNASTPTVDERSIGSASDGEVEDYAVTIATASKAKLILVKRITAIKDGVTGAVTNYSGSVADLNLIDLANYQHCNWPTATGTAGACTNTYLTGATTTTAPKVQPGDEIEYTIYYLNGGANKAAPAKVCDRLNPNLTFQTQGGSGIGWSKGGASIVPLTNTGTDADKGQLTDASVTNCNLPNNSGVEVVAVDVGDATTPLMGSTGAGTPTTSYGYIRFKAKVK